VKTGNPSAYATADCKVCKSAIALVIVITRESVTEVLIKPIIQTITRYFRHAYHLTRASMSVNVI
jgi:hypothetical protein